MTLKQYLQENKLRISQVAEGSGIPYSTVSELVNEKKTIGNCNARTVYSLARYLNTTMEDLLVSENEDVFPNKYALTREQNLFLAKKKWDENVYCGMRMEARAVTFPETRTILDGINVANVSLEDILAIRNMRDAWQYILNSKDRLDLDYVCKLNSFISRNESLEWGVLRTGNVGISGCSYKPPVPIKVKVEGTMERIIHSYTSATERAIELFCFITYNQLYWDGNKRTAMAAANKLLMDNGCGMMIIHDDNMQEFNVLLLRMYKTGNKEPLKEFLYSKTIIGIDF